MFTAMFMCQELKQCKKCLKVYAVTGGAGVVFEWKLRAKTDRQTDKQINKSHFQADVLSVKCESTERPLLALTL